MTEKNPGKKPASPDIPVSKLFGPDGKRIRGGKIWGGYSPKNAPRDVFNPETFGETGGFTRGVAD